VDSSGNVYVVGNATGDFGSQINQGSQDVYLTKYDSAGNVQWTQMLGSASSASGYSLTLDSSGNPIVVGSTTSDLTPTAIADGNNDTFVTKYDSSGDQDWTQQLQTLNSNQANTVTTDASGNIYIGGQVTGAIAGGQTNNGGTDGYVAKLNSSGKIQYEQQLGTSGNDTVSATATAADGSLYVASVQNGEAIVSKYANGNATSAPVWTQDLGSLQNGGTIGGIAVSGSQIYLSGTTTNANLTAGGTATVAKGLRAAAMPMFSISPTTARRRRPTRSAMSAPAERIRAVRSRSARTGLSIWRARHPALSPAMCATSPTPPTRSSRRSAAAARSTGSSNMAAWTANPPARRSRSIPTAPACWTHSACRMVRSISTSRSI
jgi:hypothetical protein